MLGAVANVVDRHLTVLVSLLFLGQEIVVHLHAGSVCWLVLAVVNLYELLIAADENVLVDLMIPYELVDEARTFLVDVVDCASGDQFSVIDGEFEAAKAVLDAVLAQDEDVVFVAEDLDDIVGVLRENQLLFVEACPAVVHSKQSNIVCTVLLDDEIVAVDSRDRLNLKAVVLDYGLRLFCMPEKERQIFALLNNHRL